MGPEHVLSRESLTPAKARFPMWGHRGVCAAANWMRFLTLRAFCAHNDRRCIELKGCEESPVFALLSPLMDVW